MRLAFISDIHANFVALDTLTDVLEGTDHIFCLGDVVGYYCQVNEVIDCLRQWGALCILGNHDHFLLHGCPPHVSPAVRFGIDYADRVISDSNRQWLGTLPLTWGGMAGNRSILLVHGSPWQPLEGYLYADNPQLEQMDQFAFDLIAFGQTHRALQRMARKPSLLNPGSVGQSRDRLAQACAMIVDSSTLSVEVIERPFDAGRVLELAVANGAGEWIGKHLR